MIKKGKLTVELLTHGMTVGEIARCLREVASQIVEQGEYFGSVNQKRNILMRNPHRLKGHWQHEEMPELKTKRINGGQR